jgi:hypothetical protein
MLWDMRKHFSQNSNIVFYNINSFANLIIEFPACISNLLCLQWSSVVAVGDELENLGLGDRILLDLCHANRHEEIVRLKQRVQLQWLWEKYINILLHWKNESKNQNLYFKSNVIKKFYFLEFEFYLIRHQCSMIFCVSKSSKSFMSWLFLLFVPILTPDLLALFGIPNRFEWRCARWYFAVGIYTWPFSRILELFSA